MELINVSKENDSLRERFFQGIFGEQKGYIAVGAKQQGKFQELFFLYPAELPLLLEWINSKYLEHDLYFCPTLMSGKDKDRDHAKPATVAWAEFDIDPTVSGNGIKPEPNIIVESSPGKFHYYWGFQAPVPPQVAENASRRVTYTYGADTGGWYTGKFLRIPLTHNYKYEPAPQVKVIKFNNEFAYTWADFENLNDKPDYKYVVEGLPPEVDTLTPDEIFNAKGTQLAPVVFQLYHHAPKNDWSAALWSLECLLIESGLSKEEAFVIAEHSAVNKYKRDKRPREELWIELSKAQASVAARRDAENSTFTVGNLLTDDERTRLAGFAPTFVEDYIEWASSKTDAAKQYHQAGAFVILSAILCENIVLETSIGNVVPNLWFMLLGDTTLTRKTTAMGMAMRLLGAVHEDALMATDASIEGLMTELSNRPKRASVFWRDEFSGMLESMNRREYYAGMVETLAKLYDSERQKRILRKEVIDVRDPRFIIFAGGIKSKILEQFNTHFVINGFIPRFVFITAESNKNNYRPMGAATPNQESISKELVNRLSKMRTHYDATTTMRVGTQTATMHKQFVAKLTEAAWKRYAELEKLLVFAGHESDAPELITPTLQRLCISALKAAVLIAASGEFEPHGVTVTVNDLVRAISYLESWVNYSLEVVQNAGKATAEKTLERAFRLILNGKHTRAGLMNSMHLDSREANLILDTLEQRGQIVRTKTGKNERLIPA